GLSRTWPTGQAQLQTLAGVVGGPIDAEGDSSTVLDQITAELIKDAHQVRLAICRCLEPGGPCADRISPRRIRIPTQKLEVSLPGLGTVPRAEHPFGRPE